MSRRFRIIWTEVAIADVESTIDYVAVHDSLGDAEKLYDKLESSIDSARHFPTTWAGCA